MLSMLALATSTDFVDRRIPNGLSLGGAVVGFAVHAYLFGRTGLGLSLLGWAVCLACFMPLYLGHGMAAGDVKLMAMVGAFLGPIDGFIACLFTLIAGATLASLALTWGGIARRLAGSLRLTASVDGVGDRAAAIPLPSKKFHTLRRLRSARPS